MKKSNVVWFILGGLTLVALGFAVGYFTHGGLRPALVRPMMAGGLYMGGFPFLFMGIRWLFGLVFWLGPLAGIVALIIVLTRRSPAAPAQPAAPAPAEQPTAASQPTETPPSKSKPK